MEETWTRISRGFSNGTDKAIIAYLRNPYVPYICSGQCLVTLGTTASVSDGSQQGHLLPAHNYAVLGLSFCLVRGGYHLLIFVADMQDDGEERYITVLNPWLGSSVTQTPLPSESGSGTPTGKATCTLVAHLHALLRAGFSVRSSISTFDLAGNVLVLQHDPCQLGPIIAASPILLSWVSCYFR